MNIKRNICSALLVGLLGLTGCQVDTDIDTDPAEGVRVDIDSNRDGPRNGNLRERVRDAVDDVDVNVGDGAVDVKVD